MVTHTYNPCYSEGRDWEDNGSRPAQADSSKTPSQPIKAGHGGSRKKKKKLAMMVHACHPSYTGSINRRTWTRHKVRSCHKID
jgi:hypothetical protein